MRSSISTPQRSAPVESTLRFQNAHQLLTLDPFEPGAVDWYESQGVRPTLLPKGSPTAPRPLVTILPASSTSPSNANAKVNVRSKAVGPLLVVDLLLVLAFLGLTFLLGCFPLKDVDFWWHLRTGDLIRATGEIPQKDLYTYTVADRAWIDLHWGYQVALSWGFERFGVVGLNLAKCAITCLALLILITARRRAWPFWAILPAWLPALVLLGGRMYIRPETLSLLYLSAFLAILSQWQRRPRLALLLPPIQFLWVNTQGLFVLGPVVLGFALLDSLLQPDAFSKSRRKWWRNAVLVTLFTALACLFNPYGIYGALFPYELLFGTMANPIFKENIGELSPISKFIADTAGYPNFMLLLQFGVMSLGGLSFLLPMLWRATLRRNPVSEEPPPETKKGKGKGKNKSKSKTSKAESQKAREPLWRLSPFRVLLFLAFSYLSLMATRNSHQFATVVGAVTAWNFGEWAAAVRQRRLELGEATAPALWPRVLALALVLGLILAVGSDTVYTLADEGRTIGLGEEPAWFPQEAIQFAGQEGMPPRFLSFHIGHAALYIYHFGPERKVFADPRLEVMGPEHFERYLDLQRSISLDQGNWNAELDRADRPVILIDHAHAPAPGATLLVDPRWRCVWFGPIASVFLEESIAEEAGFPAVDFRGRHFGTQEFEAPRNGPEARAFAKAIGSYVLRLLESKQRPGLARSMIPLGLDAARTARRISPRAVEGWSAAATLEFTRDPIAGLGSEPIPRFRLPFDPLFDLFAAKTSYFGHQALRRDPDDTIAKISLVGSYLTRGMDEAALPILEQLAAQRPRSPEQAEQIAQTRAQVEMIRDRLGVEPTIDKTNGARLASSIDALLRSGRAASAAALIADQYPPGERAWQTADRLATLYLHLGRPERARAAWQSVKEPPRPALRTARLASTYYVEEAFDAARKLYQEAIAHEPDLFEAHYGLALVEHDAGQAAEAFDAAERALQHAPTEVARETARQLLESVRPYVEADRTVTARRLKGSPRHSARIE